MKELKTDIIVIASGPAGLAAAITAAEGGAGVIVFEKAATTGGTAKMGSGLFAAESRLQKIKQIMLTRDEAFKIFMDFTQWRVNGRLVRAFIDKSPDTIDWLESMGVEFMDVTAHGPGNYHVQHTVRGPDSGPGVGPDQVGPASAMMEILADKAKQLGITFYMETPVKKILKEAGKASGVIAKGKSGEEITARADAVIVATGGYSDGMPAMPEITGDGIRMAGEAGAETTGIPVKPEGEKMKGFPPPLPLFTSMIAFRQKVHLTLLLAKRINQ